MTIREIYYIRPEDMPSKDWLMSGPAKGVDIDTWTKVNKLNDILDARRAAMGMQRAVDVGVISAKWCLEAQRRLLF
jgi:hypothetical protein